MLSHNIVRDVTLVTKYPLLEACCLQPNDVYSKWSANNHYARRLNVWKAENMSAEKHLSLTSDLSI